MKRKLCKNCNKLWTYHCPIRVWGRTERNYGLHLDVDPDRDYCSRWEKKIERPHSSNSNL